MLAKEPPLDPPEVFAPECEECGDTPEPIEYGWQIEDWTFLCHGCRVELAISEIVDAHRGDSRATVQGIIDFLVGEGFIK